MGMCTCTHMHTSSLSSCFRASVKGVRRAQWGCMSSRVMCLPAQLRPLISLKKTLSFQTNVRRTRGWNLGLRRPKCLLLKTDFVDVHTCMHASWIQEGELPENNEVSSFKVRQVSASWSLSSSWQPHAKHIHRQALHGFPNQMIVP